MMKKCQFYFTFLLLFIFLKFPVAQMDTSILLKSNQDQSNSTITNRLVDLEELLQELWIRDSMSLHLMSNSSKTVDWGEHGCTTQLVLHPFEYSLGQEDEEELISNLQQSLEAININQDVYIVLYGSKRLSIWEAYRIKDLLIKRNVMRQERYGTVRIDWEHLSQYRLKPKVSRRSDFQGVELIPVLRKSVPTTPFPDQKYFSDDLNLLYASPVAAEIYLDFKQLLNFSAQTVFGDLDILLANCSSTEFDLSVYFLVFSSERAEKFQMLQPLSNTLYEAYFHKPHFNLLANAHTYPFKKSLWIGILVTWIIFFISVSYLCHLSRGRESEDPPKVILWWIVTLITLKCSYSIPSSIPKRIAFLTGCVLGLVLYLSYSSLILSHIMVPKSPIKNFGDLIQFQYTFTTHEKSKPLQTILKRLVEKYGLLQGVLTVDSSNQIRNAVEDHSVATLAYRNLFYKEALYQNYTNNFICDNIASVPSSGPALLATIVLQKGSMLTEFFNYRLLTILERGFVKQYHSKYETGDVDILCRRNRDPTVSGGQLTLKDAQGPFFLLAIGAITALLITVIETLIKRCRPISRICPQKSDQLPHQTEFKNFNRFQSVQVQNYDNV